MGLVYTLCMQCPHCGVEVPKTQTVCSSCDYYVGPQHEEAPPPQKFLKTLRPKSRIDFYILIFALIAIAGYWGFLRYNKSKEVPPKQTFEVPNSIEPDLVRIHRTAEDEVADEIHDRWTSRGFNEVASGVYEFSVIPYKPVFFFATARGTGIDRQAILEEEISRFKGELPEGEKVSDNVHEEITFLCANFVRGKGLVSMSAICVWDDGKTVGTGVRIAGGDVRDTLQYTADARKAVLNPQPPLPFEEPPRKNPEDEGEIAITIRDIVASLKSYNCDRFNRFLPQGAEEMFRERITDDLLDGMKDPVERVCFVLSTLELPRSETMKIEMIDQSDARITLLLKDVESRKQALEWSLLKTSGGYKVDPEWAYKKVYEHMERMKEYQSEKAIED